MTAPNFDRVARIYRWAEYLALGPLLQRTRTSLLPQVLHCRNALLLGDGDGRFASALLRAAPQIRVTAVDASPRMLASLRARCSFAADRLTTREAALPGFVPGASPDLIVTHFFLDCFSQLQVAEIIDTIARGCSPDALWLVSDFAVPTRPVLRSLAKLYIRALYAAFALLTGLEVTRLPDPQTPLVQAGFRRLHRRERLGGLLYTELWQRDYNLP